MNINEFTREEFDQLYPPPLRLETLVKCQQCGRIYEYVTTADTVMVTSDCCPRSWADVLEGAAT